jgi:hypothetical protein
VDIEFIHLQVLDQILFHLVREEMLNISLSLAEAVEVVLAVPTRERLVAVRVVI